MSGFNLSLKDFQGIIIHCYQYADQEESDQDTLSQVFGQFFCVKFGHGHNVTYLMIYFTKGKVLVTIRQMSLAVTAIIRPSKAK